MAVARNAYEGFAGRWGDQEYGRRSWKRAVEATDWTRVLIEARGLHARRDHTPSGDDLTCGECVSDVLLVRNWPAEGGETFEPEPPMTADRPVTPPPEAERPKTCRHCGDRIERTRWNNEDGWKHQGTGNRACRPTTLAEPICLYCHGAGSVAKWSGCGCGRGVSHVVDCGTRPPRVPCESCNGTGAER